MTAYDNSAHRQNERKKRAAVVLKASMLFTDQEISDVLRLGGTARVESFVKWGKEAMLEKADMYLGYQRFRNYLEDNNDLSAQ